MKKPIIHMMGPTTGGVSKTTTARLVAETLERNGLPWRGIESDAGNTSTQGREKYGLHKLYPHRAENLPYKDLLGRQLMADRSAWSAKLMELAEDETTEHLLIDVAATHSLEIFRTLEKDRVLRDLREMGARIVLWHPIGHVEVKYLGIADWLDWIESHPDYRSMVSLIVVLHMAMGQRSGEIDVLDGQMNPDLDFAGYRRSDAYRRALQLGVQEIIMPTIDPKESYSVAWEDSLKTKVMSMGEWAVAEDPAEPRVIRNARRDIKDWLRRCDPVIMGAIEAATADKSEASEEAPKARKARA